MSPQINPKNRGTGKSSHKFHNDSDRRYSDQFIDSGALSDESIQAKGCFFKVGMVSFLRIQRKEELSRQC